jgi:very-short-patch-repair endonuclease
MAASEDVLWRSIRKNGLGFSFRRQLPIGPYILDFYCAEASLCVEVDGELHELRKDRDVARDRFMESRGIETLRIRSLDLFEADGIAHAKALERISAACERRSGRKAIEERMRRTRLGDSDQTSSP